MTFFGIVRGLGWLLMFLGVGMGLWAVARLWIPGLEKERPASLATPELDTYFFRFFIAGGIFLIGRDASKRRDRQLQGGASWIASNSWSMNCFT